MKSTEKEIIIKPVKIKEKIFNPYLPNISPTSKPKA